jgi:serine/threonine-protein kinase
VKQLVSRCGPLELPRIVSILRQTAAALNKAGQENIVHRDIKPENILIMPSGEVKVADFGLARVLDPTKPELTQIGLTMGTPLYMSPEQVEGKALDARSDLYSCGVTAFYMMAGHPPFEGDTPLSIAIQHLQKTPPDIAKLRPDLPAELCDVVQRLLAKKPRDRYRSAADLLRDLRMLKVEGADYHLPLEADALPEEGSEAITGEFDVTRQLQSLMETQALIQVKRGRRRGIVLAILFTALLGGGLLARLTWSGPLLKPDPEQAQIVDRKPTAEAQYIYAVFKNTESAWLSVKEHYPPEESPENMYQWRRTLHQLGLFYLDRQQWDRAYEAFAELASLPPTEREFRAIGLAGQALVHDQRNEMEPLSEKLTEVWNDRDLLDPELRNRLEAIIENRGIRVSSPRSGPNRPRS